MAISGITLVIRPRAAVQPGQTLQAAAPAQAKMSRQDGSVSEDEMNKAAKTTKEIWANTLTMTSLQYMNR